MGKIEIKLEKESNDFFREGNVFNFSVIFIKYRQLYISQALFSIFYEKV